MESNLIDRQAAIDALKYKWDGMVTSVFDVINSLPSAHPDVPDINVGDMISRQAAIDAIRGWVNKAFEDWGDATTEIRCFNAIYPLIIALPSAQPEAKPPKWVAEDRYVKNRFAVFPHCPQCNAEVTMGQCYCMICGQHIDWSEDDE